MKRSYRLVWSGVSVPSVLALCLLAFDAVAVHAQTPQLRYNLISIVTDDQASWSIGAYGNRDSRTPNMDRLAREGALFTNALTVTPVCSPSRASFLTGRYGTQLGITDWITPQEARDGLGLPVGATTWPEVLQRHGYVTGLIGKWHLGELPQFHPTRRGHHHFLGFLGGGNRPMNPTLEVSGKNEQLTGALPDILTDDAMKFVEANRQKAFSLSLHYRAPHLPYGPVPQADSEPFKDLDPAIPSFKGNDDQQVKRLTRDYYASVHSVDRNLGRLLAHLDTLGLAEKTIIVFTSDHGYNIGHHGLHTKGNGQWMAGGVTGPKRPNMFETSIRIPLLVRWPGVVKPGTIINEVVSNLDTFATVLGMLELPLPPNVKHEGVDFSPLLRGQMVTGWRNALYGQYDLHNGGLAFMRMIRTAEWKLVRHHLTNLLDELYDLRNDPGETQNLYNDPKHRDVRAQLQQRLTTWQQSINDPLLERQGPVTH